MPCGGIYPVRREPGDCPEPGADRCYYCTDPIQADHFVEEWDAFIHGTCVRPFLETEEGRIVLDHGHEVVVAENGTITVLTKANGR